MRILNIDPGPIESAFALLDEMARPLAFAKVPNDDLARFLVPAGGHTPWIGTPDLVAIEMVASYGMAVGAEVFDTCVWIGRYAQLAENAGSRTLLVKRPDVKMHHCHNRGAKDSNIRQALVDRFAYGQPNFGKGTKKSPGFFYGFGADVWQAYALGVKVVDDLNDGAALQIPA